jgi:hypothetical protein
MKLKGRDTHSGLVVALIAVTAALTLSATGAALAQGLVPQDNLKSAKGMNKSQMLNGAAKDIGNMKSIRGKVLTLLETTREEEKDLLKLNCINEKLSAIKGFLKVSEQSLVKMRESGDKESVAHQFALVSIAGSKVQNLGVEAQSCAGEVLRYSGLTEIIPEIDPDIAEIDSTNIVNETETLFRLPEVTPYQ